MPYTDMTPPFCNGIGQSSAQRYWGETNLEELGSSRDDMAAGAVDNGIEIGPVLWQQGLDLLIPAFFLVDDTALCAQLDCPVNLVLVSACDVDVAAACDGKGQGHEGDAAANARDQNVSTGDGIPALDLECAPCGEASEGKGSSFLVAEVLRALFQLGHVDGAHVLQRASGVGLGAAHDGISLGVLWPFGVILPARAGVQDDALVEPCLGCWGGAGRCHDADAVCEERDAKGSAGVEVLADEEVAVVERSCCESYDGLSK